MNFIKKINEWVNKGVGRSILLALVLALFVSAGYTIYVGSLFNDLDNSEFKRAYFDELGCEIRDYELDCKLEYFVADGAVIDLTGQNDYVVEPGTVVFRAEGFETNGEMFTYRDLMTSLEYDSEDITYDDMVEFLETLVPMVMSVLFVTFLIGSFLVFLLINLLHTAVQKYFIERKLERTFEFKVMYGYTMFALIPFVLINFITRSIFGITLISYITGFLPIFSTVAAIVAFYFAQYFVVKFIIENGKTEEEEYGIYE